MPGDKNILFLFSDPFMIRTVTVGGWGWLILSRSMKQNFNEF